VRCGYRYELQIRVTDTDTDTDTVTLLPDTSMCMQMDPIE